MITFNGFKQQFVATMAPKPNTVQNFWQMIIEKKVSLIVMLTDLEEGGRRKSDQYWPDRDNERREIGTGISLQHVSSSYQGVFITRKDFLGFKSVFLILFPYRILNLYHRGQLVRQVTHLQTKKWADLTAPEDTRIMLDMVQDIRSRNIKSEPVLVHCSTVFRAGVGRTGTFIGVYKLVEEYHDEK